MKRHVYVYTSLEQARSAIARLRAIGFDDEDIALVAPAHMDIEQVHDYYADSSMSFTPAATRGALVGGAAGVVTGLLATIIPGVGIVAGGVVLLGAIGAAAGAWASALVGATVSSDAERAFKKEIEQGNILLIVATKDARLVEVVDIAHQTGGTAFSVHHKPE